MTYLNSPTARRAAMLACVSTLTLSLTACKVDNRPLLARNGAEPAYVNSALPAPGPLDLAYAPAVQVRAFEEPYEAYSLAERAYGMDRAFYQAEPDYGFDYGEVEPWGWQTGDDWTMYAEPIDDGYRFYYYEPEAEHPYFVRDDQYGYGYDDSGALVALFTLAGVLLPQTQWYDQADVAGRYYYRGEDLRRTARRERRYDVQDTYWRDRAPVLVAAQTSWIQAGDQQQDWRTYRTRTEARDLNRFEPERARRAPRIDRAIEPDRRTLAAIAEAQTRPARDFRREERRADRQDRREARNERPQDRAFEQQARLEQRQIERGRDDSQRMERQARDQARQAERQQQQAQRQQAENGRREQQARQERDQARESQRQQREQRQQAGNGRRQEMARAAQEERGRAEQRERQRSEQQARQAEQQRGTERQMARNAERQGREAAAREQQRQQHQQHQQAQGRPEGGRGGGGEDRGGGGNGKGGGKKD